MASNPTSPQVAAALEGCRSSDPAAFDRLVELLYGELRGLASRQLGRMRPGDTLDTTSLVHELYVKMAGAGGFADRAHFLAASATAMRHILVNAAQRKLTAKRGGGSPVTTLEEEVIAGGGRDLEELLAISRALESLQRFDARMCAVVECRFFAGMTEQETASALGTSERTVRRDWQRARAWLRRDLAGERRAREE